MSMERFLDVVQGRLPGLVLPAVKTEAVQAAYDLCDRALVWRMTQEFSVTDGVSEWDISSGWHAEMTDAIPKLVLWAKWDGGTMYPVAEGPAYASGDPGIPRWWAFDFPMLRFTPEAAAAGTLAVRASLVPGSNFDELPDFFFAVWFQALEHGTLGRLHSQPAKPYSSVQLAEYHMRQFRRKCEEARAAMDAAGSIDQPTWRYPYFASGRRR